jgi:hypothetical protein
VIKQNNADERGGYQSQLTSIIFKPFPKAKLGRLITRLSTKKMANADIAVCFALGIVDCLA